MNRSELIELFGEPIYTYTSEQAVADGALHYLWPDQWPWLLISDALLRTVEAAAEKKPEHGTAMQRLVPLVVDFIREAQRRIDRGDDPAELSFPLSHTVAGTVWGASNECGGLTLMTESDL